MRRSRVAGLVRAPQCHTFTAHKAARNRAGYDPAFEEGVMRCALGVVLVAGIGLAGPRALAAGPRALAGEGDAVVMWDEAQSLRELPAGIQALLGVGLGAAGGIADRGDRFNPSDVEGDNLPMRRFALAILQSDTAVVALEQGGRGYSVRTVEFHLTGSTWEAVRCAGRRDVPQRGADLLDALAAHPHDAALPCRGNGAPLAASDGRIAVDKPARAGTPATHHVRQRPGA
jgi:hypothetical protein